ncbi:Uncharacterized protein OBRU01_07409 [Operophtera brumata]|uniref:Uncharacterized protein n=1 Tax=Operophtera brumata TaxID=104452 RepID=A0A0L7L994_OPEBR|nr:Uncharacterized protein OBRU01_07409 [Operophtera brumata]
MSDETKFNIEVSKLDKEAIQQVADVLVDPPAQNKYNTLRTRLLAIHEESENRQLQKIIVEMELGEQKPSQLLRRMRDLSIKRRVFSRALPHPRSLRKWYENSNTEPGFTTQAFEALKTKSIASEKSLICTLVADEMAIRQQTQLNGKSGNVHRIIRFNFQTWQDMKAKVKRKQAVVRRSANLTGGGSPPQQLTAEEEQVLTTISESAVVGHSDSQES